MELGEGLHAPLPSPPSQTAGRIECQPHRTVTKLAVSVPRTGAYLPYPMSIYSFRGILIGVPGGSVE
jgi:hypothetical protein